MFKEHRIIAHRGLFDNKKVFENTIESFKLAIKKNYIIELDIHKTVDNQIIVFHDYNTKRLLDIDLIIENSTYEELSRLKRFHIPTLEEVLKLVNGKVPLLIELKQRNKIGKLEKLTMELLNNYNGEYGIQSFNYKTV